jgi:PmbA protein
MSSLAPPLSAATLRARCAAVVAQARAAGLHAEAFAESERVAEATLRAGELDTLSTIDETVIGLRVWLDGRVGFATTNDPDGLDALLDAAAAVARATPADAAFAPPPGRALGASAAVDPAILALTPGDLAAEALALRDAVRAQDPRVSIDSATVTASGHARAIVSSTGADAAFEAAGLGASVFGMAIDGDEIGSFADASDEVRARASAGPAFAAVAARFVRLAVGALGAGPGVSFRGPVVLHPEAVAELILDPLLDALRGDRVRTGRSPLAGRVGQPVASPAFSLHAVGAGLPGFALAPFDREGHPRASRPLIEQGVLRGFFLNHTDARALGLPPTGDATGGASGLPGTGPAALTIAPGGASSAALHAGPRVLALTRFSGTTDAVSGDFSGVCKGGFLWEGGHARPVREVTVAGNLWEALHALSGVGDALHALGPALALPLLRVEGLSVTAG